jgi:hypothetical protein
MLSPQQSVHVNVLPPEAEAHESESLVKFAICNMWPRHADHPTQLVLVIQGLDIAAGHLCAPTTNSLGAANLVRSQFVNPIDISSVVRGQLAHSYDAPLADTRSVIVVGRRRGR